MEGQRDSFAVRCMKGDVEPEFIGNFSSAHDSSGATERYTLLMRFDVLYRGRSLQRGSRNTNTRLRWVVVVSRVAA